MLRRWNTFLQNSQNKASLLQFISNCIKSKIFHGLKQKKRGTTYNEDIYSSDGTEPATLSHCNHEEGDYRVLRHCENMSTEGVNQAITATSIFSELSLLELWVEFEKTANRKYITIYEIVKSLGPKRADCLTLFHSLTGFD